VRYHLEEPGTEIKESGELGCPSPWRPLRDVPASDDRRTSRRRNLARPRPRAEGTVCTGRADLATRVCGRPVDHNDIGGGNASSDKRRLGRNASPNKVSTGGERPYVHEPCAGRGAWREQRTGGEAVTQETRLPALQQLRSRLPNRRHGLAASSGSTAAVMGAQPRLVRGIRVRDMRISVECLVGPLRVWGPARRVPGWRVGCGYWGLAPASMRGQ
jgi:hypothetical protein